MDLGFCVEWHQKLSPKQIQWIFCFLFYVVLQTFLLTLVQKKRVIFWCYYIFGWNCWKTHVRWSFSRRKLSFDEIRHSNIVKNLWGRHTVLFGFLLPYELETEFFKTISLKYEQIWQIFFKDDIGLKIEDCCDILSLFGKYISVKECNFGYQKPGQIFEPSFLYEPAMAHGFNAKKR